MSLGFVDDPSKPLDKFCVCPGNKFNHFTVRTYNSNVKVKSVEKKRVETS